MRILIVDDDQSNRMVLLHILKSYGSCDVAADGLVALAGFKSAHETKHPYDVIFLDIMMPEMDGHEVLKNVRDWEDQNLSLDKKRVNVVMVSALSNRGNVLSSFKEGCEYFLVKPITKDQVVTTMSKMGY